MYTAEFTKEDLSLLEKISEMGFDGVEFNVVGSPTFPAEKLPEKLEETGLKATFTTTLSEDQDLINPDEDVRRTGIEFLKEMTDLVSACGGDVLGGVNYAAWGKLPGRMRTDKEWNRCRDCLKEVAQYAQTKDVDIAMEPVNRFETYFLNTAKDGKKLAEEIGEPNVGVHLDTFHMNIEEKNFYDPILDVGDKLYHFHICENDRGVPGSGHVNWRETFSALKKIDYDRAVVVESFVPEIEEIANQTAIWRQIAPSAEAILEGALEVFEEYGK